MFNSTLIYEPAVLRLYAERFLLEVPTDDESFCEAYRLLHFLRMFPSNAQMLIEIKAQGY